MSIVTKTMKSYQVTKGGGLASLIQLEQAIPAPGAGQALVRIHASSINAREQFIIEQGRYPLPIKPDVVPLTDAAGEIVALGEGAQEFQVGDRVLAMVFPNWLDGDFSPEVADQFSSSLDGMLTEYIAINTSALLPIPEHLSYKEAATLPCAALTAYNSLMLGRPLQSGETLLTSGTGNVSLFATQFAHALGAKVIITTSRTANTAKLQELGADTVINYREQPEWSEAVLQATNGRGANQVIAAGNADSFAQSLKSLAMNGEMAIPSTIENSVMNDQALYMGLFLKVASFRGVSIGHKRLMREMLDLINKHQLRPVIDRVYSFEQAREALAYAFTGQAFGKIVISIVS